MRKRFSSVSGKNRGKLVLCVVTCVLLCAFLAFATGCRDTDALKEIIIDQNADLIDYDNPLKYYINDSTAEEESDRVSALEVSDEDPESDIIQNLIIYSSDPNTEGYTAKHSLFSAFPDFTGIEASDTVFFYYSDALDAFDHPLTSSPEEEEMEEPNDPEEEQQEITQSSVTASPTNSTAGGGASTGAAGTSTSSPNASATGGATGTSDSTPDSDGSGGDTGTNNADDSEGGFGGGEGGEDPMPEPGDGGGGDGGDNDVESPLGDDDGLTSGEGVGEDKPNIPIAYSSSNPDADPPKVDSIAAFGDYALIVQMIGGSGALAATDTVTLSALQSNGVQTTAVSGWSGNSGDPSELNNVYNIVDSGAKTILVEDAKTYTKYLNSDRYNILVDNGIEFVELRTMYTSTNIKANVNTVGQMLDGSSVAAYGADAVDRASYYEDFHNRLVNVNSGLANDQGYGRTANKVLQTSDGYSNDADGLSFSDNTATYTVLVNDWESDAQLHITSLTLDPGLGFASVGYAYSPFSYYMQAGGTINLAAASVSVAAQGLTPVLQFAGSEGYTLDSISYLNLQNIYLSGGVFSVSPLLDSRMDFSEMSQIGKGLGSDVYPKLLVANGTIKDAIVSNSYSSNSVYHPYGYNRGGMWGEIPGISYNNGQSFLPTSIGAISLGGQDDWEGRPNDGYPEGYIYPDSILVNPCGYFCDWTSGTVESFLESGWIASCINGVYDYGQWQTDVRDFYNFAWGINADMSRIDVN